MKIRLLVLSIVLPLCLGAWCDTPLHKRMVAYVPSTDCNEGETWTARVTLAGQVYTPAWVTADIETPACVAFDYEGTARTLVVCCAKEGYEKCKSAWEFQFPVQDPLQCPVIYKDNGGKYSDREVAAWNERKSYDYYGY